MVILNAQRVLTVSEARASLKSLISDAQDGQITHLTSNGHVVAHIVPTDAWIIDDPLALQVMLTAVIDSEVAWAATHCEWSRGHLDNIGDHFGRILGWAWRTDPDRIFMQAITTYVANLSVAVGRVLTLDELHIAMVRGFGAGTLGRSEIAAALAYAAQHWQQWCAFNISGTVSHLNSGQYQICSKRG